MTTNDYEKQKMVLCGFIDTYIYLHTMKRKEKKRRKYIIFFYPTITVFLVGLLDTLKDPAKFGDPNNENPLELPEGLNNL